VFRSRRSAPATAWRRAPSSCGGASCAEPEAPIVAGVRPEALFVELTAPVVDKTEVLPTTPAWEVELDLGAGVVLRLRRGAPC
jgi:hypothetical protein